MAITTYYTTLGVPESASFKEIQKAYREKALEYHPDRCKLPNAAQMFIRIQKAYEVLSDPERRLKYDNDLNAFREEMYKKRMNAGSNTQVPPPTNESYVIYSKKKPKTFSIWRISTWSTFMKAVVTLFAIIFFLGLLSEHAEKELTSPVKRDTVESVYRGNRLNNGDSPYIAYFGPGVFERELDNYIEVSNGTDEDAVVIFRNVWSNTIVRNVYVRAGTNYRVANLPESVLEMKCMYGNDWNPNLQSGSVAGGFERNVSFSAASNSKDYFDMRTIETAEGYSIPYYQVTLHKVRNGNMHTKSIDSNQFFGE